MSRVLGSVFGVSVLALLSSPVAGASLEVRDAWIREAPPAASVLAAYMVIRNAGTTPVEISPITSPDFDHTELHRSVVKNGVASMVPYGKLDMTPGEQMILKPGGIHLMLIDPRHPLHDGDTVTLTFEDADGHASTFLVPVVRETGDEEHHH